MENWKSWRIIVTLLLASCGAALGQDKNADLAIVVNPASTRDDITLVELAKVLKAERAKSPDGVKYVIVLRETGSPERAAALKIIYQMTDAECEKFFLQATFAGTMQEAPKKVASGSSVRQFVASTPGAIGYLRASEVDSSVKVLKIDGKSPGDSGYPIKID